MSCCTPHRTSPPAWFQGSSAVTALCQDRQCLPPKNVDCRSPRCSTPAPLEAELGFCRPPSLLHLGKACPLTRERVLSAGEHGHHGVAPDASQSSRLRETSCLRCCLFHQTVTVPCCDVDPSRGDASAPSLRHVVQNWNRPSALATVRCDDISSARHTQQMAANILYSHPDYDLRSLAAQSQSFPPFPLPVKSRCSKQPTSQRALLIQVVWHPCCSSRRCLIVELSYVPSGPVCVSHNPSGLSSLLRKQFLCGFFLSSHRVDRSSLFFFS